jgi:thiol-disulfide isomerase/thioredoxin
LTSVRPRLPGPGSRLSGRLLDALALLLVAFALWKLLAVPRFLAAPQRHAPLVAVAAERRGVLLGKPSGRVTFVDFWATWCEPCRLSLPLVEAFAVSHPDVDVVAVDVGERPDVAREYAREHGIKNVMFDEDARAASAFGVNGYPTIVVIDPRGYVRAKWTGFNPAVAVAMGNARAVLSAAPGRSASAR